ncbi:Thiol:disulfide interchange protein DsbA [Klebsiella spallanzanii]|uniref:Thiol:disulfide interchange protein DsbA n=1 Tax=Klebsiella spallanzanii TaxID=2587528 RepID=A0ABY6VJI1_9ENTR|nr:thiol:disulfide interchange protein DsbA/DsbL [Klebsiella spallanzanii]MDM4206051.1 thiol:disulfide interchange protein DsbA/DsbL [Klebsiella spallanzanii]VUS95010.1 Thiol:disulfide interchange protein DsbA [Klebsiella spallanzanii]
MKIKPITAVGYTFLVALISSLITVLCYHLFVFNTFSLDSSKPSALREIDRATVAVSPIKHENSIIEVMSYGCHYCASNEEDIEKLAATLPANSTFEVIHITAERNGLAVYAPVFATLEVMGIERQLRDQAYNSVMTRGINLADSELLDVWLKKNDIDVVKYHQIRQSKAVADRLEYMAKITELYDINATPLFIVNKKYVVAKDRQFPEFADYMRQLLTQGKE